ncbi:MAG: S-adenosylmethionine synthetase N-terminal domain-containing protein, partial [Bowdeniella nasicola]|nr:S-adenosylmethionine synthetase N-terminal domain-containing protein [Bowdeniella nasicola]
MSLSDNFRVFTSESVTEGHPDKLCDQISDAILDAVLTEDPHARVAVETLTTTGLVHVVGELSTTAYVEIPDIVRSEIRRIGYTSSEASFDADSCGVCVSIDQQSGEIAQGVDKSMENRLGTTERYASQGAGDQGLMFGYACNDTPTYMPLPIYLAHRLTERMTQVRRDNTVSGLFPDGKS